MENPRGFSKETQTKQWLIHGVTIRFYSTFNYSDFKLVRDFIGTTIVFAHKSPTL